MRFPLKRATRYHQGVFPKVIEVCSGVNSLTKVSYFFLVSILLEHPVPIETRLALVLFVLDYNNLILCPQGSIPRFLNPNSSILFSLHHALCLFLVYLGPLLQPCNARIIKGYFYFPMAGLVCAPPWFRSLVSWLRVLGWLIFFVSWNKLI